MSYITKSRYAEDGAETGSPNVSTDEGNDMFDSTGSVVEQVQQSDESKDTALLERRKVFGQWLRDRRTQARITQAELAKALNYDSSQLISNIERGVSLLPSRRIPDFARVLGCSLLEMEVRYFQCSARNTSESRMPDLLLKYLPLIENLEFGRGTDEDVQSALWQAVRQIKR